MHDLICDIAALWVIQS